MRLDFLTQLPRDVVGSVAHTLQSLQTIDGLRAAMHEYILLFPAAMCLTWMCLAFIYVFRRERWLPMNSKFNPRVAVVVAAHNEEASIALTIESLLASAYRAMEVHVVSDGSTDRTVDIARLYEKRGVIVHALALNGGKSKALEHVLERTSAELFMVVDADTVADPQAIGYMVQQFADPHIAAVTGNARVANIDNVLTAVQAMEYASIIGLIKRADSFWGGLFTVSGAAACFRAQALRDLGGWSSRSATEDIEVSWRLQRAGHRLAYEPRAVVHVQAPLTLPSLFRQRRRWAQGMFEVLQMHGGLLHTANPALIPLAAQAIGTLVWIAMVLVSICGVLIGLVTGSTEISATELTEAYVLFAVMLGLFTAQSIAACTFDSNYVPRSLRLVPLAALYPMYYWIVIVPSLFAGIARALRCGESGKWERTARTAPSA